MSDYDIILHMWMTPSTNMTTWRTYIQEMLADDVRYEHFIATVRAKQIEGDWLHKAFYANLLYHGIGFMPQLNEAIAIMENVLEHMIEEKYPDDTIALVQSSIALYVISLSQGHYMYVNAMYPTQEEQQDIGLGTSCSSTHQQDVSDIGLGTSKASTHQQEPMIGPLEQKYFTYLDKGVARKDKNCIRLAGNRITINDRFNPTNGSKLYKLYSVHNNDDHFYALLLVAEVIHSDPNNMELIEQGVRYVTQCPLLCTIQKVGLQTRLLSRLAIHLSRNLDDSKVQKMFEDLYLNFLDYIEYKRTLPIHRDPFNVYYDEWIQHDIFDQLIFKLSDIAVKSI